MCFQVCCMYTDNFWNGAKTLVCAEICFQNPVYKMNLVRVDEAWLRREDQTKANFIQQAELTYETQTDRERRWEKTKTGSVTQNMTHEDKTYKIKQEKNNHDTLKFSLLLKCMKTAEWSWRVVHCDVVNELKHAKTLIHGSFCWSLCCYRRHISYNWP